MPLDDTTYYNDIRRRAGIQTTPGGAAGGPLKGTTPAYDELNQNINVSLSPADLNALIAVLEYVQTAKELVPTRQLLDKIKKLAGRQPPRHQHNPLDPNNPYLQTAVANTG